MSIEWIISAIFGIYCYFMEKETCGNVKSSKTEGKGMDKGKKTERERMLMRMKTVA